MKALARKFGSFISSAAFAACFVCANDGVAVQSLEAQQLRLQFSLERVFSQDQFRAAMTFFFSPTSPLACSARALPM
jgi:hypothetical protein